MEEIEKIRKIIEDFNFGRYEVEEKRKASNMQMVLSEKIWNEAQKENTMKWIKDLEKLGYIKKGTSKLSYEEIIDQYNK